MAILFEKIKIAYFDIPKVASSSVKLALHEIETGESLLDKENIEGAIHWIYPSRRIHGKSDHLLYRDYWKFAIVRDPLKRLMSAYSNRIVYHKDQYRGKLSRTRSLLLGIPLEPEINTFFTSLKRYRLQSGSVRHHTNLAEYHIGKTLSNLDAVYPIEKIDLLAAEIEKRTGKRVEFPRLQVGGPVVTADMLSRRAYLSIMDYLRPEYDLLRDYYAAPEYSGPDESF